MKTCLDCLHYELCDHLENAYIGKDADKACAFFKDRSLCIEPPCKVGDTVYVVSQGAGFSVVWNVYKATAKAIHLDRFGTLFVHVETDRENIGGYVESERLFLTREEAEKKREEIEKALENQ